MRHNIVVLGGHTSALFLVRSFGPLNPKIAVVDNVGYGEARFSRYCTEFHKVQKFSRTSLIKTIEDIERRFGPCAIFPSTDETAQLLSLSRDELSDIHLPMIPEWSVTKIALDKQETYALARRLEIPVPETYYPQSVDGVEQIAQRCQFPVIIKPSTTPEFRAIFRKKALWARSQDELVATFSKIEKHKTIDGVSIQEYIPGPNTDFCNYISCFDNGKPAFECTITRGRQYPIDFGTATWATLASHDRLYDLGRRLISNMNFWGMTSTQFKYCRERDKYYLLDVSARAWKHIGIIPTLGINLPLVAYQLRIGEEPSTKFEQPKEPHIWVDALTDFYVSLATIAKGEMTIGEWLGSYRGKIVDSTFSKEDPVPGVVLLLSAPWLAMRGMR